MGFPAPRGLAPLGLGGGVDDLASHDLLTSEPYFPRLRLPRTEGVGPSIKALVTGVPRGALPGGVRVSQAPREAVLSRPRGAGETVRGTFHDPGIQ